MVLSGLVILFTVGFCSVQDENWWGEAPTGLITPTGGIIFGLAFLTHLLIVAVGETEQNAEECDRAFRVFEIVAMHLFIFGWLLGASLLVVFSVMYAVYRVFEFFR